MWFTETPWPPIFIGIAAALLLLSAWARTGRRWCLYAAIAFGVACVGVLFFERWYVTELEEVEAEVPQLVAAVEADDVDKVLSFLAEDEPGVRGAVQLGMSRYRIKDSIRLTDVQVRYDGDPSMVITHFRATGTIVQKSGSNVSQRIPTRWELTWRKSGGKWKVKKIQRLNFMTGKKMQLFEEE